MIRRASIRFPTDSLLWSNLTKTTNNANEVREDFMQPVFIMHQLIFLHIC